MSIVLNFHDNWIRIEDFSLIGMFLWEAACLAAIRQTRIVSRSNFAPTLTYKYPNLGIFHKLPQTKSGTKWKLAKWASNNVQSTIVCSGVFIKILFISAVQNAIPMFVDILTPKISYWVLFQSSVWALS